MKLDLPVEVEHDEVNTFVAIAGTDYAAAKVFGKDAAERKANAEIIVKACNAHADLVAALGVIKDKATMAMGGDAKSWLDELYSIAMAARAELAKLED